MDEILWITLVIFIFLIALGFVRKDPILHLISFIVGILLSMDAYNDSVYLFFAIIIVSIYVAYYALFEEWDLKDGK